MSRNRGGTQAFTDVARSPHTMPWLAQYRQKDAQDKQRPARQPSQPEVVRAGRDQHACAVVAENGCRGRSCATNHRVKRLGSKRPAATSVAMEVSVKPCDSRARLGTYWLTSVK